MSLKPSATYEILRVQGLERNAYHSAFQRAFLKKNHFIYLKSKAKDGETEKNLPYFGSLPKW